MPTALEWFKFHWDSIPARERDGFSAVPALAVEEHGRPHGTPLPRPVIDSNSLEIRHRYRVTGEKWRVAVLRAYSPPEIGGYRPHYGHRQFVLCLGYRSDAIKRYFLEYDETQSDDFVLTDGGQVELLKSDPEDWEITFADTGVNATLADRLRAVRHHIGDDEVFLANDADVLTAAPLDRLVDGFVVRDTAAAFLTVRPTNYSFHVIRMRDRHQVERMDDVRAGDLWISGGYFILRREVLEDLRPGEALVVEPFARLAATGRLVAFQHEGFWAPMDTIKDMLTLQELNESGAPPWAAWRAPDAGWHG